MSYCSPDLAKPTRARLNNSFPFAPVATTLLLLLTLSACSGVSVPGNSSTASTPAPAPTPTPPSSPPPSTSSLTISGTLPSATVGSSYNATLSVSGGTAPYVFSVASGQLPAGILLADSTGVISGTPAAVGNFVFAISVSDSKGLSGKQSLQITVSNSTTGGNSFLNLQQSGGWASYGQGPPDFVDCSPSPCDGITFSMSQGVSSPSMSGSAAQFNLGGAAVYTDALFNNHLIGAFSSQGMPDNNHTLVPTYHTFTYDVYFYGTNLELSQAVEFDINQFFNNLGFIWGHECRIAGGHEWDVWNNVTAHWTPTGIPCNPVDNSWNHLTIQVQRTPSNQLLYQSITLNGVTNTLNQYYDPGSAVNWYGVTINYQMDGNSQQSPYTVYLDELTFTYE
ncbi:MAG: Ig domain-containing protein [Candidatus Sulfotelmatobacter sp.]